MNNSSQRWQQWIRRHPKWTGGIAALVILTALGAAGSHHSKPAADQAQATSNQTSDAPTSTTPAASTAASAAASASAQAAQAKAQASAAAAQAAVAANPLSAVAALAVLPIHPATDASSYDRTAFGEAWTDNNDEPDGHNGCDTRNDILRRDLTTVAIKPGSSGCVVLTGVLHDPYTGGSVSFVRGTTTSNAVQIDHVVALGDAWQTGASAWTAQQRVNLANDPLNLLAVDQHNNESKGDKDAASWTPPAGDCAYAARQIAVKMKFHLWTTTGEHSALASILSACPTQQLPVDGATPLAATAAQPLAPQPAAPKPAAPTTTRAPVAAPTTHAPQPATNVVHPGSYCAPAGATGVTSAGTPMVCGTTPNSPTRNRWHAAG